MASLAALKSWTKIRPSQAYIPVSWGVALLLMHSLLRLNDPVQNRVARAIITAHHLLLRVGELLRMTKGDLLFGPLQRSGFPRDASLRIPKAKTGINQHVRVNDPHIARLLYKIWRGLPRRTDRMFPITYGVLRNRFRTALRLIGVDETRVVFHSLRHGGATKLAYEGLDLQLIAIRGRWKKLQNAAHYVQVGQALITTMPLSDKLSRLKEHLEGTWDTWGAVL